MASPQPNLKARLVKFLNATDVPGTSLIAYVIEQWGLAHLVFLIIGVGVGWGFVWFGYVPDFVIADYRVKPDAGSILDKPRVLEVVTTEPKEWLRPQVAWLEDEGQFLSKEGNLGGYNICALSSQLGDANTPANSVFPTFTWVLQTDRQCQVSGFGFKQSGVEFLPLDLAKTDEVFLARFIVPEGSLGGDVLLAVVRLSWKVDAPSCECVSSFTSRAE